MSFEKGKLSAKSISACVGLPIRKTVRSLVNKQTFLQHVEGGIFATNSTAPLSGCSSSQVKRGFYISINFHCVFRNFVCTRVAPLGM